MLRALSVAFWLAVSMMPSAAALAQDGTCVGAAWISGDRLMEGGGPDFAIYKFQTTTGAVTVYAGCCSEASGNTRTLFATIDGIVVNRATGRTGFNGYLVEETHGDEPPAQLHFYGDGLTGDDRDRAFFQRVHFGKVAAERCKRG